MRFEACCDVDSLGLADRPSSSRIAWLRSTQAKVPVEVEVYSMAQHGWCVPDMPAGAAGPIYKKDDAERAWAKLEALYKASLV